jgi:spermidine/putrescine-binding protein
MKPGKALMFAAAAAVLAASPAVSHADEVVVATWGGTWGAAIEEQAAKPFEAETGDSVKLISGVSLANMQMIAAQRDNPQVDIIMLTTQDAVRAYNDGLLAPLSTDDVPNLADLPPFGTRKDADDHPMFAGMWIYPYGIIYRTDKLKDPIKCWSDLWKPEFKNKVAVSSPKYMSAYFLLMVNKIAGGTEADIEPGIDKIKEMGENLLTVADDSATQQRLIAQGEVWASPMLSSSAYKVIDQGVPAAFVIPCEGAPAGMDVIALVKGAPHADAAKKFINFYISPKTIANVTKQLKITPVNTKAEIDAEHAKYTIDKSQFDKLVQFDDNAIINDRAAWQDTWDRQIAPMTSR